MLSAQKDTNKPNKHPLLTPPETLSQKLTGASTLVQEAIAHGGEKRKYLAWLLTYTGYLTALLSTLPTTCYLPICTVRTLLAKVGKVGWCWYLHMQRESCDALTV
jgi:hypothetical protein